MVTNNFEAAVQAAEQAPDVATTAALLEDIRHGVITGEGPCALGRIHPSRTLDGQDAAWCRRLLVAGGPGPVSRAEAEALFRLDQAALEKTENGVFDDLLVKAVLHHVLSVSGHPVPERRLALSADRALADWAPPQASGIDRATFDWANANLRKTAHRSAPALAALSWLVGATALPVAHSMASLVDLAS